MMRRIALAALLAALAGSASAQQTLTEPEAGPAVSRWVGAAHESYFAAPSEWARFQRVMSAVEFRDLRLGTERTEGFRREAGHLVMTGCAMRACETVVGGLAVEIETGRPMAVFWRHGAGLRIYGAERGALPPALAALAARVE